MMEETSARATTVSVLDPEALSRDGLCRLLGTAGIRVIAQHTDPGRFLASLGSERPDVAIVNAAVRADYDSLSLVQELHQFHPDVSLLVLVGGAADDEVERFFEAGAAGCLDRRTSGFEGLLDAIRRLARGERVVPSRMIESFLHVRSPGNGDGSHGQLARLSPRERQVLSWISSGADNLKIASHLDISERTVKAHVSSLYRKLAQENRTQLALLARQMGVRPPPESPTLATR